MIRSILSLSLRYSFALILLSMSLLFSPLVVSSTAQAHTLTLKSVSVPQATTGHATIIVLDMSGSMGTNDPQGYRCSAADAYIDLSDVNSYIGLVGLDNNNGATTGVHNFQTAPIWAEPTNTATLQDKESLKQIIANKSNSCRPDNTTPTYEALHQAYDMLQTITQQHHISGSVILLTDGTPAPDTDSQIAAINSELLKEFQAKGWPIDTIGLGADAAIGGNTPGTFHDFLKGISDATGGTFYDDGKGPVAGISPLNIATFFVQIFARYSGYTPTEDIPPTQLDGGTTQRNFQVTGGTNKLAVVVVKDSPNATVALLDPNSQTVAADGSGVFVSTDAYHVIYSIDQPQPGAWIVSVTGSGNFLMYSLKKTQIGLSISNIRLKNLNIPVSSVLPLGQPLEITANLTVNGQPITDRTYSVNGTISYGGGAGIYSQPFTFSDNANPGIYIGDVTVPTSAPAGAYAITLTASTGSLQNVVSSDQESVRLEIFPVPSFLSPQTSQPTDTTVNATAVQWPWPLSVFYSLPFIDRLSGWPLQNLPAQTSVILNGLVQWQGHAYPNASIKATAYNSQSQAIPVIITQDAQGNFTAQFKPSVSDLYTVVFETSGSFKDSHGSFGPTKRSVNIQVVPATGGQIGHAMWVTSVYLALLAFIILLFRFFVITPRPYGEWVRTGPEDESEMRRSFSKAHRDLYHWFVWRNHLYSRDAAMPRGLEFRFRHGGRIEVRPHGPRRVDWQFSDGSKLRSGFQRVSGLVYRAGDEGGGTNFTIVARRSPKPAGGGGYGGYDSYDAYSGFSGQRSSKKAKRTGGEFGIFNGGMSSDRSSRRQTTKRRKQGQAKPWEIDSE